MPDDFLFRMISKFGLAEGHHIGEKFNPYDRPDSLPSIERGLPKLDVWELVWIQFLTETVYLLTNGAYTTEHDFLDALETRIGRLYGLEDEEN